jgi:hypothetical protein
MALYALARGRDWIRPPAKVSRRIRARVPRHEGQEIWLPDLALTRSREEAWLTDSLAVADARRQLLWQVGGLATGVRAVG